MALFRKRCSVLNGPRLLAAFMQYPRAALFTLIAASAALAPTARLYAAKSGLGSPAVVTNNSDYPLWVDGVKYTSMAACYADIPLTGGVCMVPPNYTETPADNFTCGKPYSGFVFTGPAAIAWGTYTISVTAGVSSCFFESFIPFGSSFLPGLTSGVEFSYTGNGALVTVGGSASDTLGFRWKDIAINLNNAGSAAVGMDVIRTPVCEITNLKILGPGGAVTQQGLILDGTGSYTACRISEPIITGVFKGIQFAGSGVQAANANKIIGGQISSPATGASLGIDFQAGSAGNIVIGTDVEQMSIGYNFGGTSQGNYIIARSEANTIGAAFGATTLQNEVHFINTVNPCSQGGTKNICTNGPADSVGTNTITSSAAQTFTQACSGVAKPAAKLAMQWAGGACTAFATVLQMPVASAGTIANLRWRCGAGGKTASSSRFTVRKNSAGSPLGCTVGTATTCNDTTHSVPVAAGDTLQITFTTQAAETLANCAASFEKH